MAALAVAGLALTAAPAAHAEPRGVDWLRVLYDVDQAARGNFDKVVGPKSPKTETHAPSEDPVPQNMGNAWFGVAPRVSLVARDWGGSMRLLGEASLVDKMRLSASTRMVVGRARWIGSRFTPFVQVGVGQWRVDHNILPLTPETEDVAGQLGGGFELRMSRTWNIAAETSCTSFVRERTNNSLPQLLLWSTFIASRIEF